MGIKTKKIAVFVCDKCKHEWQNKTKRKHLPKMCPKCKTVNWNKKSEKTDGRHFKGIDEDKWFKETF